LAVNYDQRYPRFTSRVLGVHTKKSSLVSQNRINAPRYDTGLIVHLKRVAPPRFGLRQSKSGRVQVARGRDGLMDDKRLETVE
jgi:hypothetical protein